MVSCDTCFLTLALVSAFLVVSMDARSWDIAVTIGQEIDFFAQNGTQMGKSKVANATRLMGLAYDSVTRTMYMSDTENEKISMYSSSLTEKESEPNTVLYSNETDHGQILAIAFHPVKRTLFWTDAKHRTIMKMEVPLNENPSPPEVLHRLEDHSPYGIALDICNGFVYWSSCEELTACRIERSTINGSDRQTVINSSLYDVYGLAIDHSAGKLYWLDDIEGVSFKIEQSNLNGTDRVLFLDGTHHEPLSIAVDNELVYWTDKVYETVWTINKNKGENDTPNEFKSYSASYPRAHIKSIITRDNIGDIDCDAISKGELNRLKKLTTPKPPDKSFNDIRTSMEEVISTTQSEKNCLNEGRYNKLTAECTCKKGFIGAICEVSVCHNYCVHGNCVLDAKGSPKCVCGTSYTGVKCERDVCDSYCLNNGSCSVNSTGPFCKCENALGSRCEYTTELVKLCSLYCMGTKDEPHNVSALLCKCSEFNETLPKQLIVTEQFELPTITLGVLVAVIGSLTIVVAMLSYHVNKLRRRPRIRKRFVVSKGGVTPLTSRPQVPADSCEITIENCCNMNICETPCFEPKLRATPTKSSSTKVEEKNSLLDSMEGADSC